MSLQQAQICVSISEERGGVSSQICVEICAVQVHFQGTFVDLGRFELSTHLQRRNMAFQFHGN